MEKKMKNNNELDKISSLPDSILHHIFSYLNTEEAVRSSVLSNRWRDIWTCLPTLKFEYRDDILDDEMVRSKCRFVDKVLILRDGSNIQKFDFLRHGQSRAWYVNDWIIYALRHNVQGLSIDLSFENQFPPPIRLFNSKSLTTLKLFYCDCFLGLNIPDSMCLPNLKTMILHSLSFSDEDATNRLFTSCPVLESLTIEDSIIHHINLRISSLSLKHLVIENCENKFQDFGSIDGSVKLYAPNLISFDCIDYMEKNYYLENLSSLVEADIYLSEDNYLWSHPLEEKKTMYAQRILKFLGALHNVTKLTLPAFILEVVSAPALLESNFIYRNLRSLKMNALFSGDCIHTIMCLLKMCPTIETLFVKIEIFDSSVIEVDWEVGLSSECLLNHLKCVEIREVKGYVNELRFLETLLKNAVVLETLMIVLSATKVSVTDRQRQLVKFREKLRALPKASSSITTMLI